MAGVKWSIRAQYKGRGDLKKTEDFLNRIVKAEYVKDADTIGKRGVDALRDATPKRTGLTSRSWEYDINGKNEKRKDLKLIWSNTNIQNYVNVALILDQGHVTKGGHWVEGRHYIEPALEPVIKEFSNELWEEVTK